MRWEAWFTLGVVVVIFLAMAKDVAGPDVLMLGGAVLLALVNIITPKEAFAGFANEQMLLVGALFVVVAALRETGAMDAIGKRMMGNATTAPAAMIRMAVWINTAMVFMINTAIVAMLLPVVTDWCRKHKVSPSKLLLPLSYLTVLRGMTTLIGTSTNLTVSGFMTDSLEAQKAAAEKAGTVVSNVVATGLRPVGLFEITPLGIACCAAGTFYMILAAPRLLSDRKGVMERAGQNVREYLVEMLVTSRLAGQTVGSAGLRHLPSLYLIEVERADGKLIAPVGPEELLRDGDRLTFTGVVESIRDLDRIDGLVPVADADESDPAWRRGRRLCEAVVAPRSPLVGQTVRSADFRALYNSAVLAVHRNGERLSGRIGDIELRNGDTLLLQTGSHFARAHRDSRDFILVSVVEESDPVRHDRAKLALGLLGTLIGLLLFSDKFKLNPTVMAFLVAGAMVATRCISTSKARSAIDWSTLIAIAASFGIGKALETSGAAGAIAKLVVGTAGQWGPVAALAVIYFLTMAFTELISNNAAAALMFPFGLAVAMQMGVSPRPFAIAIMFSASLAFATPIGYQTNLMVYGPGGYKFSDFTRIGLPLNILLWIICVALIPILWPFVGK